MPGFIDRIRRALRETPPPVRPADVDVAGDLAAAYSALSERELSLQNARRTIASLVVTQRLEGGAEPDPALVEVEAQLRAAVVSADVRLGSLRRQLDALRGRLELGNARVQLTDLGEAVRSELADVQQAMQRADSIAIRLEAEGLARAEVDAAAEQQVDPGA